MTRGRLVERGTDDFAVHGTFHVRHFLRTLINEKDDQDDLGRVRGDRVGDLLQKNCLSALRRRDDQPALSLAERAKQIHDTGGEFGRFVLEGEPLIRKERSQVVKAGLRFGRFRILEVDRLHTEKGEIPFALLGRTDLAGNGITGTQIESLDLGRRYIDIVRAGQIIVFGRTEKPVSLRQDFQNALAENEPVLFGLSTEDPEDQLLLSETADPFDLQFLSNLKKLGNRFSFHFGKIHRHTSLQQG